MEKIKKQLFDEIISIHKYLPKKFKVPNNNENCCVDIETTNENIKLILDIDRKGRIELKKAKMQERYKSLPLIRVDIDSPPHRFSDGHVTSRNHIHIFNVDKNENDTYDLEEFDKVLFQKIDNFDDVFNDFCSYCNIEIRSDL